MNTSLKIIGHIESDFKTREDTPRQGCEGGIVATLHIKEEFSEAMEDLKPGMDIILLTWLHEADRNYLKVHPRGNKSIPMRGVFSTRSPDRPNPIGVHPVTIISVDGLTIRVQPLEAIDNTPLLDIKNA